MKNLLIFFVVLLIILTGSCQTEETKQRVPTPRPMLTSGFMFNVMNTTFNTGSGTGGYFITFNNSKGYRTFGFCDICSGGGSLGVYIQNSREIIMKDTLCFENKPHFTDEKKYIDCESPRIVYYIVSKGDNYYLSENAADTLNGNEINTGGYPKYDLEN